MTAADPSIDDAGPSKHALVLLNEIRELYNKRVLCDFTLVASDGREFRLHRTMLLAYSTAFKTDYMGDLLQGGPTYLKDVDSATLSALIDYIYSGCLAVSKENVAALHTASAALGIPGAVEICSQVAPVDKAVATTSMTIKSEILLNEFETEIFEPSEAEIPNPEISVEYQEEIEVKSTPKKRGRKKKTPGSSEIKAEVTKTSKRVRKRKEPPDIKPDIPKRKYEKLLKDDSTGVSIVMPPSVLQDDESAPGETKVAVPMHKWEMAAKPAGPLTKCSLCDKAFLYKSSYKLHQLQHRRLFTDFGRSEYLYAYRKRQTMSWLGRTRVMIDDREGRFCSQCSVIFRSAASFNSHCTHMHSVKWSCLSCGLPNLGYRAFKIHCNRKHFTTRVHLATQKLHFCRVCDRSFKFGKRLLNHMAACHPGKLWTCQHCNRTYTSQEDLKTHQQFHEFGRKTVKSEMEAEQDKQQGSWKWFHLRDPDRSATSYRCPMCFVSFPTPTHVQHHLRAIHKTIVWLCEESACGYATLTRDSLENHRLQTHCKDHQCAQCQYKANSWDRLQRHIQRQHATKEPARCDECNVTFKHLRYLREHQKHTHGGNPCCHICGKSYKSRGGLIKHIKSHEPGTKFQCSVCNQLFNSKEACQGHMNSHFGLEPFQCSFCGKTFARRASCGKHEITCANRAKGLRFFCEVCGLGFLSQFSLKEHVAGKHSAPQHKCTKCHSTFKWRCALYKHVKDCHQEM